MFWQCGPELAGLVAQFRPGLYVVTLSLCVYVLAVWAGAGRAGGSVPARSVCSNTVSVCMFWQCGPELAGLVAQFRPGLYVVTLSLCVCSGSVGRSWPGWWLSSGPVCM